MFTHRLRIANKENLNTSRYDSAIKSHDIFDVPRLWEKIEGRDIPNAVAEAHKLLRITGLGRWIAGHVYYPGGRERGELSEEFGRAAFPWWIDDDYRVGRIKR